MYEFKPETPEQMKKRVAKALEPVYDCDAIAKGKADLPEDSRAHIFDFTDGIRLIISRDKTNLLKFLHVSASSFSRVRKYTEEEFITVVTKHILSILVPPSMRCQSWWGEAAYHMTFNYDPPILKDAVIPEHPEWN